MATHFRTPRGCCLAFSLARLSLHSLVRNPPMPHSPLPHPVTSPDPAPRSMTYVACSYLDGPPATLSLSHGAVVRLLQHPFPGPVTSSCRSGHVYTPPGRQQPSGTGPLDPHSFRDRFVLLLHGSLLSPPLFPHTGCFRPTSPRCCSPGRQATIPMSTPYWPTCVLAREHSGTKRLWPSRDPTTCTPANAWRDGVFCMRAPHMV